MTEYRHYKRVAKGQTTKTRQKDRTQQHKDTIKEKTKDRPKTKQKDKTRPSTDTIKEKMKDRPNIQGRRQTTTH